MSKSTESASLQVTSVLKPFSLFALSFVMFENAETLHWSALTRPYGQAERALGELAHALKTTPLHATWLWRELTRVSVTIAQIQGYRVQVGQLRLALIGAPLERDDNTSGLAAAKRFFLAAEPLLRGVPEADSRLALLPASWHDGDAEHGQGDPDAPGPIDGGGDAEKKQLLGLLVSAVPIPR
ncbi:MAG: hypothetical protein GDA50_08355 [Alphaproteobacteria bacterium GM202ARS2]|nr:hypothetical protein [Alphaproteobacteria bacterium GM202ARS2]